MTLVCVTRQSSHDQIYCDIPIGFDNDLRSFIDDVPMGSSPRNPVSMIQSSLRNNDRRQSKAVVTLAHLGNSGRVMSGQVVYT
jgi:hypothetical protein